jgi:catechol 2,3-dioxygenase-like lactoylglutathione lyase family enzyme
MSIAPDFCVSGGLDVMTMVAAVKVVDPPKEALAIPSSSAPLKLTGWDHVAIVIPDLVAAERWYVDVLGAEVVGRYNWAGDTDHPVGPHVDIRLGKDVISMFHGDPTRSQPRLIHYAFNCRDMLEQDQWRAHLDSRGVEYVGPKAHTGFGVVSIYFNDPWGYKLEIATWLPDFPTALEEAVRRGGSVLGDRGQGLENWGSLRAGD